MVRELREQDAQCSIAQAASVIGDWWSLLIVREVTRGHRRFDDLLRELGISRKVLTERLKHLVEHGVLARRPYQAGPVRHEYVLTETGWALAPTLVSMQDWADRWLLGDGSSTGAPREGGTEQARVRALLGTPVPTPLLLPATLEPTTSSTLPSADPTTSADVTHPPQLDVVADTATATILFTYPSTGVATSLPPNWDQVPGAVGCTLENRLFRDRFPALTAAGVTVHGVSTQRPDEQAAFATAESIPFPLLSDMDLHLTAALRLPTFRAGQDLKLKRLILVIDRSRTIRHVIFPVLDIPSAITEATNAALTLH
ncbi:HxlR family transcriptional regulator [[Actinomadura] parvosata subsp. kistnae]|uniref:HxlR family transcriptional regulator n=2 Tax=Nonomuraea TaxID=83681 RepID=A0A1V0A7T1_9ACTN|nr:winged helix-turn-helix transcriptional regulator [Nonomuraea sp. ATCC 55076]AQZ66267.1 HxlR family transcriptional regulator [Nonomuraea sp. ATCC 55076]